MKEIQKIWKFKIPVDYSVTVCMPQGANVLHVGSTGNPTYVEMWALVNPDAKMENRVFYVRGTGAELGEAVEEGYIGTVVTHDGKLVWHIFEHIPNMVT
jgi:hypothetical protein